MWREIIFCKLDFWVINRLYSYTRHVTTGPLLVNLNSSFHLKPAPIRYKTDQLPLPGYQVGRSDAFSSSHSWSLISICRWFYFDTLNGRGEGRADKKALYGEATFRVSSLFHRLKYNYWTIDWEAVTLCYPSTGNVQIFIYLTWKWYSFRAKPPPMAYQISNRNLWSSNSTAETTNTKIWRLYKHFVTICVCSKNVLFFSFWVEEGRGRGGGGVATKGLSKCNGRLGQVMC